MSATANLLRLRPAGKKKLNLRQKRYKEVVQQRISTKTPPVQYTRRLKTRKHKKLKHVVSLYSQSNDSQHVPASFKELMQLLKSSGKRVRPPYLSGEYLLNNLGLIILSGVGDTQGMRKPCPENKIPKQGKHESDAHYIGRVHKEVADEMARLQFAKTQKVCPFA
ncbi:peptidase [Clonorchis sinensis]|uniref:Peptidase n=1 Tax=Clonorchis sinensis TaxID=79923 RepID=G7YDJ7_CLOSI|nr:peptidase [Clonorchis sinensis]